MAQYWETLYAYFRKQGLPHRVLNYVCITAPEARQITGVIEQTKPKTILEVGTFVGLSTGVLALASGPASRLVCVDPNLPIELLTRAIDYRDKRSSLTFVREMLKHFALEQKTVLLPGFFSHLSAHMREELGALGDDPEQAPIVGEQIGAYAPYDLAFIDGDHSADAVTRDLLLLHPYLSQNAIIVLHDVSRATSWSEQVLAGAQRFRREHSDFSLKVDHNLGFLSRDAEKAWLPPQSDPLIGRVRRRVLRAWLDVAARLKGRMPLDYSFC